MRNIAYEENAIKKNKFNISVKAKFQCQMLNHTYIVTISQIYQIYINSKLH